jgi:hypothetical protein
MAYLYLKNYYFGYIEVRKFIHVRSATCLSRAGYHGTGLKEIK